MPRKSKIKYDSLPNNFTKQHKTPNSEQPTNPPSKRICTDAEVRHDFEAAVEKKKGQFEVEFHEAVDRRKNAEFTVEFDEPNSGRENPKFDIEFDEAAVDATETSTINCTKSTAFLGLCSVSNCLKFCV